MNRIAVFLNTATRMVLTDVGKDLRNEMLNQAKKLKWDVDDLKDYKEGYARRMMFEMDKRTVEVDTSFDDLKDSFDNFLDNYGRKKLLERYQAGDIEELHKKMQVSLTEEKNNIRREQIKIKNILAGIYHSYSEIETNEWKDRNGNWAFDISIRLNNKLVT